ncbi:MAG: glucosidase [Verrucomicrobiota bacterium]|nr:glucosidase [Verrucomicrobiota bacterium]
MNAEQKRIAEAGEKKVHWRQWGPFLSERQWGTVREDYSEGGDAWNYFPFEQAASRAYRWGEDGIGGLSDNHQRMCLSFAFWNGKDSMLKERMFGLTNAQGNHGEDVKEYYYYLDNTPTHSYMQMLYKYPQGEYPYENLKQENGRRSRLDPEYELIDTGLFDDDRYFDIFIEYAKATPDDILIRMTAFNRASQPAKLHVILQAWLRNVWAWSRAEPCGKIGLEGKGVKIQQEDLGERWLSFEGNPNPLFTNNETNFQALFNVPNRSPYVKDAFHEVVVRGNTKAVNPANEGTKAGLHSALDVPAKGSVVLRYRFSKEASTFADFDKIFAQRKAEADDFYRELAPAKLPDDRRNIQRQAFAGLLWSKQFYHYIVEQWLAGDDPANPPPPARLEGRNHRWKHLYNDDILSMPDKWEYPWFAAWDLAFHCISFALMDPWFAKRQLSLLTREWYMHPNGQVPAYEWNFEDVDPPMLAWAAWRVFKIEKKESGQEDREFLERIFQKLIMSFTWWVNRKDSEGKNVFEGGFLGLDNISLFNRSSTLPAGGKLTQSDGTSWMAAFCLNMWTIAIELADKERGYEDMVSKFFEHFLFIADAINYQHPESPPLWNEEDGFYYDVLQHPDGSHQPIKIRSMVGLIPLFAVATLDEEMLTKLDGFKSRFDWFLNHRDDLCLKVACMRTKGHQNRRLLSILDREKLRRILEKMLDENEFLSPYGIRAVSRYHKDHPYTFTCGDTTLVLDYEPGESTSALFGGNSNWRGPIWFPLNYLIIESLQKFAYYYADDFKVECPTGSGHLMNLSEIAHELSTRLIRIFEPDSSGHRPVFGATQKFQKDPNFQNYLLFHEYFHGDDGSGLGASHQTGWTALVAKLIHQCGKADLHLHE